MHSVANKPLNVWVSLCWMSLCSMSLCSSLLCWMSLCCHYAECHYAVIMLNVIMLNVIMLSLCWMSLCRMSLCWVSWRRSFVRRILKIVMSDCCLVMTDFLVKNDKKNLFFDSHGGKNKLEHLSQKFLRSVWYLQVNLSSVRQNLPRKNKLVCLSL